MARILEYSSYTTRTLARIDPGRVILLAAQAAVLGGIALFVMLAVVNTLLGAPAGDAAYSAPYQAS